MGAVLCLLPVPHIKMCDFFLLLSHFLIQLKVNKLEHSVVFGSDQLHSGVTLALKYDISFSKLCQLGTMFPAICVPFQSQSKRKQNKISGGNGKKRIFGKKVHFWILKSCI